MKCTSARRTTLCFLVVALFLSDGCHKEESASTSSSDNKISAGDAAPSAAGNSDSAAAARAVQDEIDKRWVKTPDGLLSEFFTHISIATGKPLDAETYCRQIKKLDFDIQPRDIDDAHKLNGLEFYADVQVHTSPMRLFNDPNSFASRQWSPWKQSDEATAMFYVQKVKGQWKCIGDSFVINGEKPSAATIAQLK